MLVLVSQCFTVEIHTAGRGWTRSTRSACCRMAHLPLLSWASVRRAGRQMVASLVRYHCVKPLCEAFTVVWARVVYAGSALLDAGLC